MVLQIIPAKIVFVFLVFPESPWRNAARDGI